MSHEILMIAGSPTAGAQQRRRAQVEHAAGRVPGVKSHELTETACSAMVLVHTEPPGGSSAAVRRGPDGVRMVLAVTDEGLESALTTDHPHEFGAEAGHVLVDIGTETATVVNDGLGFVPAYWGRVPDGFVLSTHLASIVSLGLPADVDEQGVAEYLVHMHPWGHRTLLERAELLAPGARLSWRVGAPVRARELPLYTPSDGVMTDEAAVAEFAELWPNVLAQVRRRGGSSRTALALSGGLDSRAIAAGSVGIGWRPMTYTYGSVRNDETRTAMRLADRLGLPQVVVPVTDERLLRDTSTMLDALDGAHSPGEMYELWFDDTLRSFADVIINGMIAGPMWGDDKTMGMTDVASVAGQLQERFAGALSAVDSFVRPGARPDLADRVRTGIGMALSGWDFGQRADMVMFWKQANKMLRWGSMLTNSLRRAGLRLEAPFLNRDFASFSARLTPAQRLNGNLYLRVHREVFAATADIERSDDGNPPSMLNHVYWSGDRSIAAQMASLTRRHPLAGLRRGGRRMMDVSTAEIRRRTPLATPGDWLDDRRSVFPADLWARRRPDYARRLADLLDSALGASTFLDDDAISRTSAQLRAGRPQGSALVLARVGAAGYWLNDYRRRADDALAIVNDAGR